MFWEIDFVWEADVNRGSGRDPKKIRVVWGSQGKKNAFSFLCLFYARDDPGATDFYRFLPIQGKPESR